MRPSYVYPATRAAFGKQEFIAGSGMMPGSGLSSTTLGTPKRSTRTSMRHQSRQPSARYAASATRSAARQSESVTPVGGHRKIASGYTGQAQTHRAPDPYTGGAPHGSERKANEHNA